MPSHPETRTTSALVTRAGIHPHDAEQYLQLSSDGLSHWTTDPAGATAFESMREATRVALRLPASLRAFGVPSSCRPTDALVH
jgi:hypothetical protein